MDMHGKINQYITVAVKGKGVFADTIVHQCFATGHLGTTGAGWARMWRNGTS